MTAVETVQSVPWWKEPTKDQWLAWVAAWLGWTLDAFDFTIFLLIMLPISQEFHVPLTAVTAVFTLTLWMRLVGATASGWIADRIGRKKPLMISIGWYSVCNFIAGFAPAFWFLFLFRALLGIGMGAEWPCGAALAMETWPIRSRGFMAGVLQASWGLGALLSSAAYGVLYDSIGWRGLLMLGVLPALSIVYVRRYVKEPSVWVENRRLQRTLHREVRLPLLKIFKRGLLYNTLTACWWMASAFVVGLLDRGPVPHLFAEGPASEPRASRIASDIAEPGVLFVGFRLGLARGPLRAPLGNHNAGPAYDPDRAALSGHRRLRDDRSVLHIAGRVRRRRHACPIPGLSRRKIPDRGTRDGDRLRLSPGRDIRRLGCTGHHLFCYQLAIGVCDPDAGRHYVGLCQRRRGDSARPRDQR